MSVDRQKIMKGLEMCAAGAACKNDECPYYAPEAEYCETQMARDALELIKELMKAQEPRVMTLEEVLDMKFDDVVYLQLYPTNAVLSAIVIDVIPKLSEINVGVVQFRHGAGYNGINNADLSYYSRTWRCWTSRPTEAQREAVKWDD